MKVENLTSGDVCQNPQFEGKQGWATVIAVSNSHPAYPGLCLVVWHLAWEEGERVWSFDALSPIQELDHTTPLVGLGIKQRAENMRRILKLGPDWRR
jgi:hypothetical protein